MTSPSYERLGFLVFVCFTITTYHWLVKRLHQDSALQPLENVHAEDNRWGGERTHFGSFVLSVKRQAHTAQPVTFSRPAGNKLSWMPNMKLFAKSGSIRIATGTRHTKPNLNTSILHESEVASRYLVHHGSSLRPLQSR